MTTANCNSNTKECTTAFGAVLPFETIHEAGCYVCNWSGHLLRVPADGVAAGRSPLINIIGNDPLFVTKISDNPYMTLTKAKMIASNLDCAVSF